MTDQFIISIAIPSIALVIGIYQYIDKKKRELRITEFDQYHKLIETIVSPKNGDGPYIDQQIAAIFELRFYRKYYELSSKMLHDLNEGWSKSEKYLPRLEWQLMDTLSYINKRSKKPSPNIAPSSSRR